MREGATTHRLYMHVLIGVCLLLWQAHLRIQRSILPIIIPSRVILRAHPSKLPPQEYQCFQSSLIREIGATALESDYYLVELDLGVPYVTVILLRVYYTNSRKFCHIPQRYEQCY